MSTESDLLAALTGATSLGSYPDTLHDRLDRALAAAWTLSTGLNITVPTTGAGAGPYRGGGTVWDAAYDQVVARYGTAPKARTLVEKAQLLEVLTRGIDARRGGTPPSPPSGGLPPGTTQGTLQWAADLSKGDVVVAGFKSTPWNTETGPSWPPPVMTGPGGYRCIAFTLDAGGKRIEVEPNHRTFPAGDDAWFGFAFYLAPGFPAGVDDWQVIWQLHGNDTTSPQQCLQVRDNQLRIADNYSIASIVPGRWYRVVVHASMDPKGSMSVWLDDEPVCSGYRAGLNATPLYLKAGWYHDPKIGGSTLYQRGHALGTGYGAVHPT